MSEENLNFYDKIKSLNKNSFITILEEIENICENYKDCDGCPLCSDMLEPCLKFKVRDIIFREYGKIE